MIHEIVDVTAVLASLSVFGGTVAGALWWIYRRGQASGLAKADNEAQRWATAERLAQLEAELASLHYLTQRQSLPRRALRVARISSAGLSAGTTPSQRSG